MGIASRLPNRLASLFGMAAVFALLLSVPTWSGSAYAQGAVQPLQPGEAYVTRFSGIAASAGAPAINVNGVVGSIIDIRNPGQAPQGQHWLNEPQRAPVTAAEVGQVFGVAFDDATAPDIFLTATSAFGLHRAADNGDWMPGMWGPGGGPGTVWKLDPANGYKPAIFSQITLDGRPNTGAALGAIAYDKWHKQLYVSDLETGMIHRLGLDGKDLGRFDHGTEGRASFIDAATGQAQSLPAASFDPNSGAKITNCAEGAFTATPACWNFADFRRRVWGLGVRQEPQTQQVRLYYAVWSSQGFGNPDFAAADEAEKRNSVWSVAVGADGAFDTASVRREYVLPDFFLDPQDVQRAGHSNPVSDIEFPQCITDPVMLVAERGGVANLGLSAEHPFASPHESRVLRYQPNEQGIWQPTGRYDVGFHDRKDEGIPFIPSNSAGGAAFGYGYGTDWKIDPAKPDQWVWMTGDALCAPEAPCFNPDSGKREDGSEVHGAQGTPAGAYGEVSPPQAAQPYPATGQPTSPDGPLQSWMIDTDQNVDANGSVLMSELTRNDETKIGNVEIYAPCPGEAGALQPPVVSPPVVLPPDVVPPPVVPTPPVADGPDLEKAKDGPANCTEGGICTFTVTITNVGPAEWSGPLTEIDTLPAGSTLWNYAPQPEWVCAQQAGTDEVDCSHEWITLASGQAVQLTIDVLLPFGTVGTVQNCIEDEFLTVRDPNDPAVILAIERQLNAMGYAVGPIDGELDAITMNAIATLQGNYGLPATGLPDQALVDLLFPQGTVDSNPANDLACHSVNVDPAPPAPPAALPDIAVRKFQQTAECVPGDLCTFELWFLNRGPVQWTGRPQLTDALPAGATLEASSAPWTCAQTGRTITCDHPFELTMDPGEMRTVTLDVRMPAGLAAGAQNCAAIGWPPGAVRDPNPGNDRECIPVRVGQPPLPDIEIQKTIAGGDCTAGKDCRFDVSFINRGPGNWSGEPTIVDTLPAGSTFKSATTPWLCTPGGAGVTCQHPALSLPPFQSLKMTLTVTLPATVPPGTQNCGRVQHPAGTSDPVPQNDQSCVGIPASGPQGPVGPVRTGTCNSTIQNGGDAPETVDIDLGGFQGTAKFSWEHYSVKDRMKVFAGGNLIHDTQCVGGNGTKDFSAAGIAGVRVEVQPNCDGTTGTQWNFKVECPLPLKQEQPAAAAPPPPPPPPPPAPSDQGVTKSQLAECTAGHECEFTLTFTNNGPGDWTGEPTLTDTLPVANIGLGSWSPPEWQCSQSGTTVTCEHPDVTIPAGSSKDVTLSLQMPQDIHDGLFNCVQIGGGATQPVTDGDPSDDQVCVPVQVTPPPAVFSPKPPTIVTPPVVTPPVVKCPPGTYLHDGVCVRICPPGTRLDHGVCVKPVITCPPGTYPSNGMCVQVCPPGTRLEAGVCVPVVICPPRTRLDHGICVPIVNCPPGTYLHDGVCVRICPAGTHLDHGVCLPNQPICPPGTHPERNQCVPNHPTCPGGTHIEGGRCVPNHPTCPPGHHPEGNTCVPNQPACPAGTHVDHGRCVPNQPACPAGTHVDHHGQCVPNQPACPVGTHIDHGKCVPNQPNCPAGTHFAGGKCVPNQPNCPAGTHFAGGRCVPNQPNCPAGTHFAGGKCVPNQPNCPAGTHFAGGKCVPNQPNCPAGTHFAGGKCVPNAARCPAGTRPVANRCVPVHR